MKHAQKPNAFTIPVRIYYEDTDAGGVVYHAQYVAFLERARSQWLQALGHSQQQLMQQDDLVFAVRAMEIDFRAPARLDDQLQVSVRLLQSRGASFVVAQTIERNGALLVEAEVRIGALRATDFRPRPMPPPLSDTLKRLLETP